MTTRVEKTIQVHVPVRTAYDQWTQFEEFPSFMGGVQEVRQVSDRMTHWVAQMGGVKREWDAEILEQVPDTKVAWAATSGATNAGAVYFTPLGPDETAVRLSLEYEPEGLVEKAGDAVGVVERRAEADLEAFKSFIESRGSATGAWRGSVDDGSVVGTPGVQSAAASRGDSGSAGISTGAAVAGAAVVAGVAAAGVAAVKALSKDEDDVQQQPSSVTGIPAEPPVRTTEPVAPQTPGAGAATAGGAAVTPAEAEAGLAGSPMFDTPSPDDDALDAGAVVTNDDLRATDGQGRPL